MRPLAIRGTFPSGQYGSQGAPGRMEGEEKKEEAGGEPLCWRATNGWFLRGIDSFHAGSSRAYLTTGDYGRKQIKARVGFSPVPASKLNSFCAHLSVTLGCEQTTVERTDSIYRSSGTCLHFKVVANLLSTELRSSSLRPVAPPCDNSRHLISSDLTSLSSPSLYPRLLHPHNHNYTVPDG